MKIKKKYNKYKKKKNIISDKAIVLETLPSNIYRIKLISNNKILTGYLCGNMVRNHIKLIKDDIVLVELTPKYSNKARIIFRK